MAMQPDIQYVSYYMDGTAAKRMEQQLLNPAAAPKPKARKRIRRVVLIDPAAIVGLVVAAVMLILMASAVQQYREVTQRQLEMSQYIQQLQDENAQLQKTYKEGYDLEQIKEIALAVGMIPAEDAERITISVQLPEPEQREMTLWEKATTFLAGLFA